MLHVPDGKHDERVFRKKYVIDLLNLTGGPFTHSNLFIPQNIPWVSASPNFSFSQSARRIYTKEIVTIIVHFKSYRVHVYLWVNTVFFRV